MSVGPIPVPPIRFALMVGTRFPVFVQLGLVGVIAVSLTEMVSN